MPNASTEVGGGLEEGRGSWRAAWEGEGKGGT